MPYNPPGGGEGARPAMADIEQLILQAWERVKPTLRTENQIRRRLARMRKPALSRPPRDWCLVIRASDHRLPSTLHLPSSILDSDPSTLHSPPSTLHNREQTETQRIQITAKVLRMLCEPVTLQPGGDIWDNVARQLGRGFTGLHTA